MKSIHDKLSKLEAKLNRKAVNINTQLNGTEIDDVLLTDLTLSYRFSKDSKLSFGAKNLFDQNYYYYGNKTKDEKMLREGRTWFTSFSYDF